MNSDESTGKPCCSFCGKSQKEAKKLIAGPTAYICDECIALFNDIILEEAEENEELKTELANTRAALEAVCKTFPPDTDIRFVMSAIIGVCEHEDGPTVVRYIGHLERLLKELRARHPEEEAS